MSDDSLSPDAFTKTTSDDIQLDETDLDEVSGGWKIEPDQKIDTLHEK